MTLPATAAQSPAAGPSPSTPPDPAGPTTAFTYQGRLDSAGTPYNGNADFVFTLFDAPTGGNPVGVPVSSLNPVTAGLLTTMLDFGVPAFNTSARWLDYPGPRPRRLGARFANSLAPPSHHPRASPRHHRPLPLQPGRLIEPSPLRRRHRPQLCRHRNHHPAALPAHLHHLQLLADPDHLARPGHSTEQPDSGLAGLRHRQRPVDRHHHRRRRLLQRPHVL